MKSQKIQIKNQIKGNILIVDDDPNITSLFKLLLKCMNYDKGYALNVDTTHTGLRAQELADKKKYDLIFMDIDLDGEDGCVTCEHIINNSNKNKDSPIVAITANINAIQNNRDNKFNLFKDIILKPFNNNDIIKIVWQFLS